MFHTFHHFAPAAEWIVDQAQHHDNIEVWCTNLGYDICNLFKDWLDMLEINYAGSRVISVKVKDTNIRFKDTLNHWKMSVQEMGKYIGLKKLDVVTNKKGKKNYNNVKYNQRDAKITGEFVKTMRAYYESIGAKLRSTIGSTALDFYYRHYGARPKNRERKSHIEFCLSGYYGGRTEIFFNKPIEGKIWYYDINSLYPSVMRDNDYPDLARKYFTKNPNFNYEGVCDVTIETPTNLDIPYLPAKIKDRGLMFCLGRFRGVYTYFELRQAKKLGYKIKKIHKALEYPNKIRPFEKIVDDLYRRRLKAQKNGDALLGRVFKDIPNNLYGKFNQGNEYTVLKPFKSHKDLRNGDTLFGDMVLRCEVGEYPPHTNGIWGDYVTAYARDKIYFDGLVRVVNFGGLLIYCDTDSIIFESQKKIIKNSKSLGEFKIEKPKIPNYPHEYWGYAHFKLPKLYRLDPVGGDSVFRAKGVPAKSARRFFEFHEASFERPYKLKEVLRRNLSPKRKRKLVPNYWEINTKTIQARYTKRRVLRDGTTKPIVIGLDKKA